MLRIFLKARSHTPKRKDCVWIANKSRLLREFYAIAGFERFKTLLRVQIDVFLTQINVFLMQLTPFLRDPYMIRAQIARHAQPRTTPPNHVKLAQISGFVRDPYAILPFGLCDRALIQINTTQIQTKTDFESENMHNCDHCCVIIELLFVFIEAVFVAPRSEELGIAT